MYIEKNEKNHSSQNINQRKMFLYPASYPVNWRSDPYKEGGGGGIKNKFSKDLIGSICAYRGERVESKII